MNHQVLWGFLCFLISHKLAAFYWPVNLHKQINGNACTHQDCASWCLFTDKLQKYGHLPVPCHLISLWNVHKQVNKFTALKNLWMWNKTFRTFPHFLETFLKGQILLSLRDCENIWESKFPLHGLGFMSSKRDSFFSLPTKRWFTTDTFSHKINQGLFFVPREATNYSPLRPQTIPPWGRKLFPLEATNYSPLMPQTKSSVGSNFGPGFG